MNITKKFGNALAVTFTGVAMLAMLAVALPVSAHPDPVGCSSNGVGLSVTVYRADGTTLVVTSGDGTVQSGETIKYQATLSHLGAPNCNFDSGTLTITTPDNVPHVVASGAGIPLVSFGVPFVAPQQSYVVSEADVDGGMLPTSVVYANGVSHLGGQNQTAGGNVNISSEYSDVSLQVEKTAVPASETDFRWTIDKSVTPATWNLFDGDSGTSEYTVAVTKSEGASNYSVEGTITIHNPAQFADAVITGVSDVLSIDGAAAVDCGVAFPYNLGPGLDLNCTYSMTLASDATQTNTATVTTSGDVGGGSGEASVDFANVVPTETNSTINVDDTNGETWEFSDSGSVSYERTFACGADEGDHGNTATIRETEQSDSASVTVNCYDLTVTKTADTTFDREWNWDIDKVGDQTELTLALGQAFVGVNYDVTVSTVSTDSNWEVSGTIAVANTSPIDAVINSVSDLVSGVGAATVTCNVDFPYTLVAGDTLNCTYGSLALPNAEARTNTATAVQQNYDYDSAGAATASGTTNYSGSADVAFSGTPTTETDECIDVTDSLGGVLGTVCAGEAPKTFEYTYDIDPYEVCGEYTVENIASFVSNDTEATGSANWTILVDVPCFQGCTLTQGYWKTHNDSFKGGAPTDDGWLNLGVDAENTTFYSSGMSWFDVFWTASKGNAYYNLAHQYMAAKLNVLDGASETPEVTQAIADAETLFGTYTPAQVAGFKGNNATRKQFIELAGILGSFNEGLIGPGHCDEDSTSQN